MQPPSPGQVPTPGPGMEYRYYSVPVPMQMFYGQFPGGMPPGAPGFGQIGMMPPPLPPFMNAPTSPGDSMMTGNKRESKDTIITSRYPAELRIPGSSRPLELGPGSLFHPDQSGLREHLSHVEHQSGPVGSSLPEQSPKESLTGLEWSSTHLEQQYQKWSSHHDRSPPQQSSPQRSSRQDRSSQRSSHRDRSPLCSARLDRSSQHSSDGDRSSTQRSSRRDRSPQRSSHRDRPPQRSSRRDRSPQCSSHRHPSPQRPSYRHRSPPRRSHRQNRSPRRSSQQDRSPPGRSSRTESHNLSSEFVKRESDIREDDHSFPAQESYFNDDLPGIYIDELDDDNRHTGPLPPDPEAYSDIIAPDNDVYPRAYIPNCNNPPVLDEVYDRFYSKQPPTNPRTDVIDMDIDNSQDEPKIDNSQDEPKIIITVPESFPGPSVVKNKEMRPIGQTKLYRCPIPECSKEPTSYKHFRVHVIEDHLPPPFNLTTITLHNRKRFCLNRLARYILGKNYKLGMLLTLVKGVVRGDYNHISDTEIANIRGFCKFYKWMCPPKFDIVNPTSPAMCLHWRLALELLLLLTENQRATFKMLYHEDYKPVEVTTKRERWLKNKAMKTKQKKKTTAARLKEIEKKKTTAARLIAIEKKKTTAARLKEIAKLPVETKPASTPIVKASTPIVPKPCGSSTKEEEMFDSHFHFDQTAWCMKLDLAMTKLADLLKVNQDPPPVVKVKVTGGVMVFSDPANYPHLHLPRKGFKAAFGIHPHYLDKFTKEKEDQMWELISQSPDGPVGAVGLDWTQPKDTWPAQERALRRVLKRCCVARPIILHIRGPENDMSVYDKVLEIMKLFCGTQQPIHIHRFSGTISVLAAWFAYFPFVYFGFAGSVAMFNPTQLEGLRHVPLDRIMVESDSPFLSPHPAIEVNTPAYLGDVASIVAQGRGVDLDEMIRASNRNTKLFYDL